MLLRMLASPPRRQAFLPLILDSFMTVLKSLPHITKTIRPLIRKVLPPQNPFHKQPHRHFLAAVMTTESYRALGGFESF